MDKSLISCKKYSDLPEVRKNSILSWIEDLEKVLEFKSVLKKCDLDSIFEIESGIVKILPTKIYISHEFVPYIKSNFNFYEISIIMKAHIVKFESVYGVIDISEEDIKKFKNIIYRYNGEILKEINFYDSKKIIHLINSSVVLYYLLKKVILKNLINGWCSLTFTVNNRCEDYCTIFNSEEISLLEFINNLINKE